jgi:hypothetical protein
VLAVAATAGIAGPTTAEVVAAEATVVAEAAAAAAEVEARRQRRSPQRSRQQRRIHRAFSTLLVSGSAAFMPPAPIAGAALAGAARRARATLSPATIDHMALSMVIPHALFIDPIGAGARLTAPDGISSDHDRARTQISDINLVGGTDQKPERYRSDARIPERLPATNLRTKPHADRAHRPLD